MASISAFQADGTGSSPVIYSKYADVAELADAVDSESTDRKVVQVQVLSSVPFKSAYSNFILESTFN